MEIQCVNNNQNLTRLRQLVEMLDQNPNNSGKYHKVAIKISDLVESGKKEANNSKDIKHKIRCYENLFTEISTILSEIKYYV